MKDKSGQLDRPTPETDAFAVKFKSVCGSKSWVPTDICRRFERERDEAREDLEFRRELYALQTERLQRIERERDEARQLAQQISDSNQVLLADVRDSKSVDDLRKTFGF